VFYEDHVKIADPRAFPVPVALPVGGVARNDEIGIRRRIQNNIFHILNLRDANNLTSNLKDFQGSIDYFTKPPA
jgi:hypothetical protein